MTLPPQWIRTGEYLGTGPGNDGAANGILAIGAVNASTANANFGITIGVLPLHLISFNATEERNNVRLKWSTVSENNSRSFSIEHSTDNRVYTAVGEVTAKGNSNEMTDYAWVHTDPATGINYYRLKMTDTDGKYEYSSVTTVKTSETHKRIVAFPNPAGSSIQLILPGVPEENTQIQLFNTEGQIIKTIPANHRQRIVVDIGKMASGLYHINVVKDGSLLFSTRMIKL